MKYMFVHLNQKKSNDVSSHFNFITCSSNIRNFFYQTKHKASTNAKRERSYVNFQDGAWLLGD